MTKKDFFKFLLFGAGLFLILYRLSLIFTLKDYPTNFNLNNLISRYPLADRQDGFYSLKKNSVDVVFVGSSNVHCNINPNVIWDQFGITSYDFSSDLQDLGTSYYYLKQAFETQSPKVAVIDVFNNIEANEMENSQAHFAFDHMKNDLNRIRAIWDLKKDDRLELYFPLITYHARWKELNQSDFAYRPNRHNVLSGSFVYMARNEQSEPECLDDLPEQQLSAETIYWIEAIRQLCREHDCACLFIKTPLAIDESSWYAYFNAVESYCRDNNIPFLYFNKMTDEIVFDFANDFYDIVHLNWDGQQKLSAYLGDYLRSNYHIENKKGQEDFAQWDEDYALMLNYMHQYHEH